MCATYCQFADNIIQYSQFIFVATDKGSPETRGSNVVSPTPPEVLAKRRKVQCVTQDSSMATVKSKVQSATQELPVAASKSNVKSATQDLPVATTCREVTGDDIPAITADTVFGGSYFLPHSVNILMLVQLQDVDLITT